MDSTKINVLGARATRVYATLRDEILSLQLAQGSPLDEIWLADRFGLSRTPVRQAVLQLASEGLVRALPNRSAIVAPINFETLPAFLEALILMYRVTTRTAAAKAKPKDIANISARHEIFATAVASQDTLGVIEANRNFHLAIAQAAGNAYYFTLIRRLLDEGRRFLRLYYSSLGDRIPLHYVEEHFQIILAIERRESDLADQLAAEDAYQMVRQLQCFIAREAHGVNYVILP